MKKLILAFIILNASVISAFLYNQYTSEKTGYILIQDVFNSFELKKDYERKLTATKNSRQKITDSLEMQLKLLGRRIESNKGKSKEEIAEFEIKREDYLKKRKLFEEDNQAQTQKYDEEIITQLNQYVKEYGKEKGYTYIMGSDGNGSLMYAVEAKNITKEVIDYINVKYKGSI